MEKYFLFPTCVVEKELLYSITHNNCIIEKMDLKNNKVICIDNPDGYNSKEWSGADNILLYNQKIYFFEQNGKRIMEYSVTDKKTRYFDLNLQAYLYFNYAYCTIWDNRIYIFPSFINEIIIVDLQTGKIMKKEKFCDDLYYIFNKEKINCIPGTDLNFPYRLFSCGCQVKNTIWIFTEKSQKVIKFDLLTEKIEQYILPRMIKGCVHAVWKNKKFYLLSLEGFVYVWKYEKNEIEMLYDEKKNCQYPYFHRIAVTDKNIWLIPFFGDDIYIVDKMTKKYSFYNEYPKDFCYFGGYERCRFYGYSEDKNNYYFAMHSANYLLIIDKLTGKEKWIKPINPTMQEMQKYYMKNYGSNFNEYEWKLKNYLKFSLSKKNIQDNSSIGNLIWENMFNLKIGERNN